MLRVGYTLDSKDIEHQENTKFELDSWYYKRLKFLLFWGMFIEGDILKRTIVMRVYIYIYIYNEIAYRW